MMSLFHNVVLYIILHSSYQNTINMLVSKTGTVQSFCEQAAYNHSKQSPNINTLYAVLGFTERSSVYKKYRKPRGFPFLGLALAGSLSDLAFRVRSDLWQNRQFNRCLSGGSHLIGGRSAGF